MLMIKTDIDKVIIETDRTDARNLILDALLGLNALLVRIQNQVGQKKTQQLLNAYVIAAMNLPIDAETAATLREIMND
ncbi:MAG: hypothetical protein LUE11_04900 [Clostridia bacterium]|nr:hypothetical protein [Clostridia bacterium]